MKFKEFKHIIFLGTNTLIYKQFHHNNIKYNIQ